MTRWKIPLVLLGSALVIASCSTAGGGSSSDTTDSGGGEASAEGDGSAVLPDVLNVGGPVQAPPYIYEDDSGEIVGLTVDLIGAVGDALGVEIVWHDTPYDSAQPALESDRIDLFTGSYTDTAERQQAVDFLDYYYLDLVLVVQAGNPHGVTGMDDLCGLTAAVARGSSPVPIVEAQSQECEEAGLPPVEMLELPSNADVKLQVDSGRADALFENLAGAKYSIGLGQPYEIAGTVNHNYAGAAFDPDDSELRDAVLEGFRTIMADGTYEQILQEWDVMDLAMDEPIINGATTAPLDATD